jgi:DNA-binding HxlR family transcriptional regulator
VAIIPRVSKKVLLEQLRQLEADGLVGRHDHQTFPPEVSYHLTQLGQSLLPVLKAIDQWAPALPAQTLYTRGP